LKKKTESNFGKKRKKGKVEKKMQKKSEKKRNALWITVVIHSDFGCGGIVIPPHHLDVCIMLVSNIKVHVE
jgi:hypothetical protein